MVKSTKQVAEELGNKIARLSAAVWRHDFEPPEIGPGNAYQWMEADIDRARSHFQRKGVIE